MRCLNYAEYFPDDRFTFLCRTFPWNIISKIVEKGHQVIQMDHTVEPELDNYSTWIGVTPSQEIADFKNRITVSYDKVIIDHYGIDAFIEKEVKEHFNCELMVITDIYDSTHYCDTFLNYNCIDETLARKINVNPNTVYKIGIEHILINKIFREEQNKKIHFREKIKNIVINMGGSDPLNYTQKILNLIANYVKKENIHVTVIIGKANINKIQMDKENTFLTDINYTDMINLYKDTDLVIGSCSITAYERLYLNVPQICLKIVDNQPIILDDRIPVTTLENLMSHMLLMYSLITLPPS
jgi:spore coat polysaccharide biosynthesis predicted glycosyltransferase SpsG